MYKTLFFFGMVITLPFTGVSQQRKYQVEKPEPVIREITAACSKVISIESSFLQEKDMSVMAEKIISKGKFWFKKEKKLRWEYTDPFPYLIIIHEDQMMVRDDQKLNIINLQSSKVFREINRIIVGAIRGTLLENRKDFAVSLEENTTQWIATLIPQDSKIRESLSEIVISFNKRDLSVDRLVMREASGDYTRISFSGKKINQPVGDALFTLP